MREKIKNYLIKIYKITQMKEMKILPGHLAYFIVLALMPMISMIALVFGFFNISIGDMFSFLFDFIPDQAETIIIPALENGGTGFNIIFIITGFFVSSNGLHSIILACNELYGFKNRSYLARHFKAILMTLMLLVILLVALLGLAFSNTIIGIVLDMNIFSDINPFVLDLFSYLKYPVAYVIIYYIVRSIYSMAPDTKINSREVIPGSIFTTVMWLIVTGIYSQYANDWANYDLFYGSISNIIILMIWIYIISYILVIGIAINVSKYNKDKLEIEEELKDIEKIEETKEIQR